MRREAKDDRELIGLSKVLSETYDLCEDQGLECDHGKCNCDTFYGLPKWAQKVITNQSTASIRRSVKEFSDETTT